MAIALQMKTYLIQHGEEQRGPYSLGQLEHMWRSGAITVDSQYWTEGMDQWEAIPELLEGPVNTSAVDLPTMPYPISLEEPPPIPHEKEPPPIPVQKASSPILPLLWAAPAEECVPPPLPVRSTIQRLQESAASTKVAARNKTSTWQRPVLLKIGVVVAGLFVLVLVTGSLSDRSGSEYGAAAPPAPILTNAILAKEAEDALNAKKQIVFNSFHPVGTAKSVKVHEVQIQWKQGRPTANSDDILACVVRFTVYWSGPIEKNGFTKIETLWDNESKQFTQTRLLATNGIHNKEIRDGVVDFGLGFLKGYIEAKTRQ